MKPRERERERETERVREERESWTERPRNTKGEFRAGVLWTHNRTGDNGNLVYSMFDENFLAVKEKF